MTFNSVRPIYEYNQTWDFKAYKAQQHSVTTLREQMQRIGVWVNELEKMRARQPCGILEVQYCCAIAAEGVRARRVQYLVPGIFGYRARSVAIWSRVSCGGLIEGEL